MVTYGAMLDDPEGQIMESVVGFDTHLDTLEAVVVDGIDRVVGERRFLNSEAGRAEAVLLCLDHGVDRVGIEGASGYGAALARAVVGAGRTVIDVSPRVTASRRRAGGGGKSDRGDARIVARAVLAGEGNRWCDTPEFELIRVVTHRRNALVTDQTRDINQLRAMLVDLDPAYAAGLRRLRTARSLEEVCSFAGDDSAPVRAATARLIRQLAQDCVRRLGQIRGLERDLAEAMPAVGQRLIDEMVGCGVITAAMIQTSPSVTRPDGPS